MILSESHIAIREAARRFARERIAPFSGDWDRDHRYPQEVVAEMGKLGFLGMIVPEDYGGSAAGVVALALVLEEISAGDGACAAIASVHNSAVSVPICAFASRAQKEEILPRLASGEWIGGFALTEPHAGSDASAIRTRAVRDGETYRLNGLKQFITSGKTGHLILAFAVTNADAGKRGISAFMVPTTSPGHRVRRVESKMGQHASDTCEIGFEDVLVPASMRLGEEGEGYRIALSALECGRIGIAAQAIGMARAALEHAIDYAKERIAFGKPIIEHQAVAFRLADMATKVEAARQLMLHAASLRDANVSCLSEASMAKLFATEMAEEVASAAVQTFGGAGYIVGSPVERLYRDVRACQIYEGTSDIQRLLIARNL